MWSAFGAFSRPRSTIRNPTSASMPISMQRRRRASQKTYGRASTSNLRQNIAPTRPRASLILTKDADHRIEEVSLREF